MQNMLLSRANAPATALTVFFALVVSLSLSAPVLGQQTRVGTARRGFEPAAARPADQRTFDIRALHRASGSKRAVASAARNAAVVSGRREALESFRAGLGAGQPEVRMRANGLGLPKLLSAGGRGLSAPSTRDAADVARGFLAANPGLFPFSAAELDSLRLAARNEQDGVTFLYFQQRLGGIDIHDGSLSVAVDGAGQVIQVSAREAAPGLEADLHADLSELAVLERFFQKQGLTKAATTALGVTAAGTRKYANPFGQRLLPIGVRPVVFVMSPSEGRLAYRVTAQLGPAEAYQFVIDADSGLLLQRRSLVAFAQGLVYTQTPVKGDPELVDFPEGQFGWLPAGGETSRGNNADVYIDRGGFDSPNSGDDELNLDSGYPVAPGGMFDFPVGEGATTGQNPRGFGAAAATNLFYFVNRTHDYFYGLGFDEDAGNFQFRNRQGRGGEDDDRVIGESQDADFTNNAAMITPEDGFNGVMQMGVFTAGTLTMSDDRDSSFSDQVVIHEFTHGVSNRRVAGPAEVGCLGGTQSGALGEGWSDYFAISITGDPIVGGYLLPGEDTHPEGGIRRAGYENYPFTYADIGNEGYEVHQDGEIWGATLWDARTALGAEVMDQLVYSGFSFTPCDPSMVDARDGILMADQTSNGGANLAVLWEVFAAHGLGASASGEDGGFTGTSLEPSVHTAAFDVPAEFSEANRPPLVTSSPTFLTPTRNQPWTYQIVASDPEGEAISYTLAAGPAGSSVDATGLVRWTPVFMSDRMVITVSDASGAVVQHGFELLLGDGDMEIGDSFPVTGRPLSFGAAIFDVPAGVEVLQATLRGTSGDADLFLVEPDAFVPFVSVRDGSFETISVVAPQPGEWLLAVQAFQPFEDVTLALASVSPTPIESGTTIEGLSGVLSSESHYSIAVPAETGRLRITTTGGAGDADILASYLQIASCQPGPVSAPCQYELLASGLQRDNEESIEVDDPDPGLWHFDIVGTEAYEGVSLTVTTEPGDPTRPRILRSTETGGLGVLNAASFLPQLSPGALGSIFGLIRTDQTFAAGAIPLPRDLGGIRVFVDGVQAPMLFANGGQVNFQAPYETLPGAVEIQIETAGVLSAPRVFALRTDAPGLFSLDGSAVDGFPEQDGDIIVARTDGSLITADNPAVPGETVILYATGLSSLDNIPATGEAAAADPLSQVAAGSVDLELTLPGGGFFNRDFGEILFAGLAPGFVGLGQINVILPDNAGLRGRIPVRLYVRNGVSQQGYIIFADAP